MITFEITERTVSTKDGGTETSASTCFEGERVGEILVLLGVSQRELGFSRLKMPWEVDSTSSSLTNSHVQHRYPGFPEHWTETYHLRIKVTWKGQKVQEKDLRKIKDMLDAQMKVGV